MSVLLGSLPGEKLASIRERLNSESVDESLIQDLLQKISMALNISSDAKGSKALLGQLLYEEGYVDLARPLLELSLEPANCNLDVSREISEYVCEYKKYLLLGECCLMNISHDVFAALKHYNRALDMQKNILSTFQDTEFVEQDVCSTLCAITEIYLTELCMQPDAEEQCEKHMEEAMRLDCNNFETLVTLASVRISQQKTDQAKLLLQQAMKPVFHTFYTKIGANYLPSMAHRINAGRLCIELEFYDDGLRLFSECLGEDNELPDLWYYIGYIEYLKSKKGTSPPYRSLECLTISKNMYLKLDWQDASMLEHIDELLEELQQKTN